MAPPPQVVIWGHPSLAKVSSSLADIVPTLGLIQASQTLDRHDQISRAGTIPMLAQVQALPGPQREPTLRNGDRDTRPKHRRLHMSRHIIGPFASMDKR